MLGWLELQTEGQRRCSRGSQAQWRERSEWQLLSQHPQHPWRLIPHPPHFTGGKGGSERLYNDALITHQVNGGAKIWTQMSNTSGWAPNFDTGPGSVVGGVRGNNSFSLRSCKDIFLLGCFISFWGPCSCLRKGWLLGKVALRALERAFERMSGWRSKKDPWCVSSWGQSPEESIQQPPLLIRKAYPRASPGLFSIQIQPLPLTIIPGKTRLLMNSGKLLSLSGPDVNPWEAKQICHLLVSLWWPIRMRGNKRMWRNEGGRSA